MRQRAHQPLATIALVVAALAIIAGPPAIGAAPQPVLPEGYLPSGGADPAQARVECPAGSSGTGSASVLIASSHGPGLGGTAYPGPVLPVPPVVGGGEPPDTDCAADLSLSLVVKSPDGRKPDGADASLDELAIPRSALESGFGVSLPAHTRTITLSEPGKDWELVSTSCTCGSGATGRTSGLLLATSGGPGVAGSSVRASYPEAVIPLPAGPRSGGCVGPSAVRVVASGTAQTSAVGSRPSELMAYPGPVLPVPGGALRPATVSWDSKGNVSIDDPDGSGGTFACTWTVELVKGKLELKTITRPPGREGRFEYTVTPTGANVLKDSPRTMRGAAPASTAELWKGPWSVELADLGGAWRVERSDCTERDPTTVSAAGGASAALGVDPGDEVRCTFELKLLAPREGRWKAVNGASVVTCGSVDFDLPKAVASGNLKVRRDGDQLVASGFGAGADRKWKMDRGPDDSLRYTGSMPAAIQGAKGKFTAKLDLINEELMKGTSSGKIKYRGLTCSYRRPLTLTYAGK